MPSTIVAELSILDDSNSPSYTSVLACLCLSKLENRIQVSYAKVPCPRFEFKYQFLSKKSDISKKSSSKVAIFFSRWCEM